MTVTNIEAARARGPDRKLVLSTGATRTSKKAKQNRVTWQMFVDKCREPTRTKERYADYMKLPKTEQGAIKDVGWFVAGRLRDGVRKKDHLETRDFVTLDVDFADKHFDFDIEDAYRDYTFVVYSTHKHNPESPRLRLVFPASRTMTPDEYPAVARMVADMWGVEVFDDTTFQPSRVMYWPSCAQDGDYVFIENDGVFIDPDQILGMYDDWTDIASWPVSSRQGRAIETGVEKALDPWEKRGPIGDFCRAYTIPDVIDGMLSDIYTKSDGTPDERYTFTGGSTTNGAIVYNEGRFLYSNHGTDPAGGHSVNAFDLVRIHRFGDLDKDTPEDTSPSKRPSYRAMLDFVNRDDRVASQRVEDLFDDFDDAPRTGDSAQPDRGVEARPAFSPLLAEVEFTDEDRDALKALERDSEGNIRNHITNVLTILKHDKRLKGAIAWNEFAQDHAQVRDLPGYPVQNRSNGDLWTDKQDSFAVAYIHRRYEIEVPGGRLVHALNEVSNLNRFHPVRDYLDGLVWDGVERLDTLLVNHLRADDTAYTRAVTRKTLTAAVARIFQPGVKFDNLLILEGAQGVGKSSFWDSLALGWFTDSVGALGKDTVENMKGKWLGEIPELAHFRKAEVEHVKAFLSRKSDRMREAYARRSVDYPRQWVLVATVNDSEYLKDTENRRFWPVACHVTSFMKPLAEDEIAQVWAEAVQRYRDGERLDLDDADVRAQAVEQQRERQSDQDDVADLAAWLDEPGGDDFDEGDGSPKSRRYVSLIEIWEGFLQKKGRPDAGEKAVIRRLIQQCPGWSKKASPRRVDGKSIRVYTRL